MRSRWRVAWRRLGLGGLAVGALPPGAAAQALLTQDEALRLAFPPPIVVQRHTAFLDDAGLERARRLAGPDVEVSQRVVTYYLGVREDGTAVGVAYFDVHRVRTLAEVVMYVVSPEGQITRAEILKFAEPPEYRAPPSWLSQLEGRRLERALSLKGAVPNMTGATLTARALIRAARRVLALHEVLRPFEERAR